MPKQPTPITYMLVALTGMIVGQHALAKDEGGATYRCHTKDAVSILQNGTMNKVVGEAAKKDFDKIVINVATGDITFPFTAQVKKWIVEQADALPDEHEYILYPQAARHFRHTTANAMTQYIRLHVSKRDPQPRYLVVTLSYIVTGTCELLQ
jgi:hypothetical protein